MSREYAEHRIREALAQSRGNPTKARQQIIAWAAEDQRLLLALTSPHLTGIVAHAIGRVVSQGGTDGSVAAYPQSLDMAPDTFGKQILNALSSNNTPVFGLESGAPSPRPKKASQSHIDALKKIASRHKTDRT